MVVPGNESGAGQVDDSAGRPVVGISLGLILLLRLPLRSPRSGKIADDGPSDRRLICSTAAGRP
jgi:hypothetical protein